MRRRLSLLVITVSILISSCTFKIQALPPIGATIYEDKLPYDAAIYIPPSVATQTTSRGGLCCIGVIHSWEVLVGDSLATYSKKYFGGIFKSATVYNTKASIRDNEHLKIIIEPYVRDLDISQTLKIDLRLHCKIQDRQDRILYERSFTGKSQSSQALGKACVGGVFLGESALRGSFSSALDNAFKQLLGDLRSGTNWEMLKSLGL